MTVGPQFALAFAFVVPAVKDISIYFMHT